VKGHNNGVLRHDISLDAEQIEEDYILFVERFAKLAGVLSVAFRAPWMAAGTLAHSD
jgi:hypothetical protein